MTEPNRTLAEIIAAYREEIKAAAKRYDARGLFVKEMDGCSSRLHNCEAEELLLQPLEKEVARLAQQLEKALDLAEPQLLNGQRIYVFPDLDTAKHLIEGVRRELENKETRKQWRRENNELGFRPFDDGYLGRR